MIGSGRRTHNRVCAVAQDKLDKLEDEMTIAQNIVTMQFEDKKRPVYEARDAELSKVGMRHDVTHQSRFESPVSTRTAAPRASIRSRTSHVAHSCVVSCVDVSDAAHVSHATAVGILGDTPVPKRRLTFKLHF